MIVKLAKEGKSSSEIGIVLRDSYGVPDVQKQIDKSITEILAEKKLQPELPEDMTALMKRAVYIRKHLERNKKDMSATRGLLLSESKIKRLAKYYKRISRIPIDWKYSPEDIKMYVE